MNKALLIAPLFLLTLIHPQQTDHEEEGRWTTDYYNYRTEAIKRLDASFDWALGELVIRANNRPGMIDGKVEYHAERTIPEVDFRVTGTRGRLRVEHDTHENWGASLHFNFKDRDWDDQYHNKIEFELPPDIATELTLDFGLGEAHLDLTDLDLTELELDCGLSDVKLVVSSPNRVRCDNLSIDSGMGDFNAISLGNLRAREINLDVGLGSATLDFTGQIVEDMTIDVRVGLGSLDLRLPRNANIRARIEDTFLSSVDVDDLVREDQEWVSKEWSPGQPTLILEVSVGLGSVDIDLRD